MEAMHDKTGTSYCSVEISQMEINPTLLPNNVMRRHINSAYGNKTLKQLLVTDSCKLFANQDGKLMNKKKTIVVYG